MECIEKIKKYLSYFPQNNTTKPDRLPYQVSRESRPTLNQIVPMDSNVPYDMKSIIQEIVDENTFLEIQPEYASNIIIGYARIGGHSLGIVANQPKHLAGVLDVDC